MSPISIIFDPASKAIGRSWPLEQQKLEQISSDLRLHVVRGRGHALFLTRELARSPLPGTCPRLLICVGDDRTLHDIINGLDLEGQLNRIPVTVHPQFHRGDFLKGLPFRDHFDDFLRQFLLDQTKTLKLDLGEVIYSGRYGERIRRLFINYVALGYAGLLLQKLHKIEDRPLQRLRLFREMLTSLPFSKSEILRWEIAGRPAQELATLTAFLCNHGYLGKGVLISSSSDRADGRLELIRVRKVNRWRILLAGLQLLSGHLGKKAFIERECFEKIRVSSGGSGRGLRLSFDGEIRGFLPAEVRVLKGAFQIWI